MITPNNLSIAVGWTQQFQAIGTFSDNSTQDLSTQVNWSSGNLSVATITPTGGLASGVGQGSALITATLNGISGIATLNVTNTPASTYTLFNSSAVPTVISANAGGPIELGMKFTADWSGAISAIRFYKGAGSTGFHVGNLWSSTGTLLASVTFTNETASGWQQANLAAPVAIAANTVYVVSYHTPGSYSANYGYFNIPVDNAPLHAVVNSATNPNGVFLYGASSAFPIDNAAGTNYWVDVVFSDVPGVPASITATAGSAQSTPINSSFATALQAMVRDGDGNPVSGAVVTFTAPGSGASGTFAGGLSVATASTNAQGLATATAFTANGTAGMYSVTATVAGQTTSFALTNLAGPPASITATAGTPQSVTINTAGCGAGFPTPLQATVKDAAGNPVGGVAVTFTAPSAGASGTFAGGTNTATVITNAQGVATAPTFTANLTMGSYTVTASVSGVATPASFALTNLMGSPGPITAMPGSAQAVQINTAFAIPLQMTVQDCAGNPVNGAVVTFTAPASGPSGTFAGGGTTATVTTNTQGVATAATFTANSIAGTYAVTASAAGGLLVSSFTLTNLAGPPASITATAGTPQSVAINTAFATLQATVKDASGNPVSGAVVTFTAPSTGASGVFAGGGNTASATTNAQGVATAPACTANGIGGTFTVNASINGVTTTPGFSLTNLAPVVSISINGVSTNSIAFGNQVVGSSSNPTTITISNTGAGSLVISGLALSGSNPADFSFTATGGALPITVGANSSTTVNVTFTPVVVGWRSAALTITDNASGSPQQVNLTGAGIECASPCDPAGQSLAFGNQAVNTTSAPSLVPISNTANSNLVISVQITGANAGDFAFTCGPPLSGASCAGTLAPNSSATVNVTFTPAAAGTRSASLIISEGGSPQAVALSGIGIAPVP
jgi:protocatechuate 3,4-dioxygenase beta subunit